MARKYMKMVMERKFGNKRHRKTLLVIILSISALCLLHLRFWLDILLNHDKQETESFEPRACKQLQLRPFHVQHLKHFKSLPSLKCADEKDWLDIVDGNILVNSDAQATHGQISCSIKFIDRVNDMTSVYKDPVSFSSKTKLEMISDFFQADCKSEDNLHYNNMHAGISSKPGFLKRSSSSTSGPDLDVLIIGFDSVSHMTFLRKLPKTFRYFKNILNGTVLNGFNIVGEGTINAITPMLTGKFMEELPNVFKYAPNSQYVDAWPLIWRDFKKNGYVTAYAEDRPEIQTFNMELRGFRSQPTDHYMRPFYLLAQKEYSNHSQLCLGSKHRSEVFLNYLKQFYTTYTNNRKFAFGFQSEVSHQDANMVQTADDDLESTLAFLHTEGYLRDTMLILMSDHGARFSTMRQTQQGRIEEKLPFFGISLPSWFGKEYPEAMKNVLKNADRLVTHFDIHATLKDIISFKGAKKGSLGNRAISLFQEVPLSRTCPDADIGPHWCSCIPWRAIDKREMRVKRVSLEVVDTINDMIIRTGGKCARLGLKNIINSLQYTKYKTKQSMREGRPVENTEVHMSIMQVTIQVSPGNGIFEATAHIEDGNIRILDEITRTNIYGDAPKCIEKQHQELRKFCFCKVKTLR